MKGNTIKKFGFRSFAAGPLPLIVLAHFSFHVVTSLTVPLLPFIRDDFSLDYTQSGLVISAFTLAYGICQLPAGWLADRLGARILITASICGVALAGLLIGLSQSYIMMIAFLVLMGIAGGGYHPAAPPLIARLVDPKNRGRVLGFHIVGGSASHFMAPLIGAAIATAWGWRSSYIGLAIPIIVFGIIFYVILGSQTDIKKVEHRKTDSHDKAPVTPGRWHYLAAFITLSTVIQAVTFSIIAFIPLFMVDHFGVDEKTAAVFLAILYSAGLWAGPLGGYLSDRFGRVPVILIVSLISGPIIYLVNLVPYGFGFGAVLLIIGITATMRMPVSEAYIIGESPERHRSTILGIYYFSGMEGGGILTPVVGNLIDRFGFYSTFTFAGAALVAVTLIYSIFLWSRRT